MKRLCLYLVYDKQNVVDRYIGYMLKELKPCVDRIVVICNMKKIERGSEHITAYADEYFMRENIGFDIGGFKDAMCSLVGWQKILQYDELLLVNDSFFGPFVPMRQVFDVMENRNVDFWGLTIHAEHKGAEDVNCPEHIQSFFTVINSRMLHCREFRKYWEELPYFKSFHEAVNRHEVIFTQLFHKYGYTYDCYADMGENNSKRLENNFVQYADLPCELMSKRNFPFFKKQQLSYDTSDLHTQEEQIKAINYIESHTSYDVGMIWENIIRTMDLSDLYRNLGLNFIVQDKADIIYANEVLIIICVSYENSAAYILERLEELKNIYCIQICSAYRELLREYEKKGYSTYLIEVGNMYESIFSAAEYQYPYVCVLKDADVSGDEEPSFVGKSNFYRIWENLIRNKNYIAGIINIFQNNKYLGYIAPPKPMFYHYFETAGNMWGENYELIRPLAEKTGLMDNMSFYKKPPMISDSFWIRGDVFWNAADLGCSNDVIMDKLWCNIVQNAGYYSGTVTSAEYASMQMINLQNYIDIIGNQVRRQYGDFNNFTQFRQQIFQGALKRFCQEHEEIYIYGTGGMGRKYRKLFPSFTAYVVSDGQPKDDFIDGDKVYYLSEIKQKKGIGIVVCLNERYQAQVIPILEKNGIENYLCI